MLLVILISFSLISFFPSLSACKYAERSRDSCGWSICFLGRKRSGKESKKESNFTADSTWPMSLADTMGAQLIFFYYWSTERVYKIMEWDLHKQIEVGREKIEKCSGVCLFVHDLRIVFIIIVIIVSKSWVSSHDRLRATVGWSCSCSRVNTLYVESIYSGILEYTKKKGTTTTNKLQSRRARWELRSARGEYVVDSFRYFDIWCSDSDLDLEYTYIGGF